MSETQHIEIVAELGSKAEPEPESDALEAPFPVDCLPHTLSEMAIGIADTTGVPLEMAAPLVLAVASAATGRGVRVRSLGGRLTGSNLYLLFSKQSGSGGSSAFKLAAAPIFGRQALLRREHEEFNKPGAEAERDAAQAEISGAQSELKSKNCDDKPAMIEKLKAARKKLQEADKALIAPLLCTNDSTSEGLAKLLSQQGEILWHADADAGDAIASIMARYSDSGAAQDSIWLKSFDGEQVIITRQKNEPIYLERPILGLCFVMTPDLLRELYTKDRLAEGGFLARCLTANVPGLARLIPMEAATDARLIPTEISQPYEAAIWGALATYRLGDFNETPAEIAMTTEARKVFIVDWNERIERTSGRLNPFEARYTEQAIRIALVLHLYHYCVIEQAGPGTYQVREMSGHERPLDAHAARAALKIRDWFADQQAAFIKPREENAEEVRWEKARRKILSIPNGITARDLYNGRSIAKDKLEAETMLARWVEEGRLTRIEPKADGAGRKAVRYQLAPFQRNQ